jgi:proteasome lid subunit RPN8/RPN11
VTQDEVDISQIEVDGLSESPFPVSQSFRIHISEQAHADACRHARNTLTDGDAIKEVGGVLVGNVYKDQYGPYTGVKAVIVAEHTRNEGTEVAFTPETWDQVNRAKDEFYPDDRIVGWYHTHPRFGIFLSERDKFIQQHSFPQPWAIAFVMDPVEETEGFFFWSGGEPCEAQEYWVGQQRRQPASQKEPSGEVPGEAESGEETRGAASQVSFALAATITLLSLLFAFGYVYWMGAKRAQRDRLVVQGLESQRAELDRSAQSFALLKSAVNQGGNQTAVPAADKATSADPQIHDRIEEVETGLRRLGLVTLLLEATVTGQEIQVKVSDEVPNNREPIPPTPEAEKP